MNPLGMVVALLGAMDHAAKVNKTNEQEVYQFTENCRKSMYQAFRDGRGTRDMAGKSGLTTEGFVKTVAEDLAKLQAGGTLVPRPVNTGGTDVSKPSRSMDMNYENIDHDKMMAMFNMYDNNKDGVINFDEFVDMSISLGIAPVIKQDPDRK